MNACSALPTAYRDVKQAARAEEIEAVITQYAESAALELSQLRCQVDTPSEQRPPEPASLTLLSVTHVDVDSGICEAHFEEVGDDTLLLDGTKSLVESAAHMRTAGSYVWVCDMSLMIFLHASIGFGCASGYL